MISNSHRDCTIHPRHEPNQQHTVVTINDYYHEHRRQSSAIGMSGKESIDDVDDTDVTIIPHDYREVHELPTVDVKTSNWKGTLISILVIFVLCSVIIFAIYIINPDIQMRLGQNLNKEKLKLSELLNGAYASSPTSNGTWISDTELTFIDWQYNFVLYDAATNQTRSIVIASLMRQHDVRRAILSSDRKNVLFISHIKNVFRHSYTARYKIFNLNTEEVITLKPAESHEYAYLQAAEWGPNGSQIAFVYRNNLYYMANLNVSSIVRITNDNDNYVYNGIPDWIYEEEILATGTAIWWSPEGAMLAFAQFDDTQVELQEYPWYGATTIDNSSQYLDRVRIKYPKPGHTNPTVKLFTVDLASPQPKPQQLNPPQSISQSDYYLTAVAWADEKSLIAVWMNRVQNYSSYSICSSGQCQENYALQVSQGWVEISDVFVGPDGKNYYTLLSDESSLKNKQIVKINIQKGELKYLTSGEKDVTAILQVTRSMQTGNTVVYYMSTRDDKPGERHAYSVEEPSTKRYFNSHYDLPVKQPPEVQCYTCDRIEQNQCLYNRISWSKQSTYYIQECLGPDIPFSVLKRADDQNSTVPWVDNQQLRKNLANKLLPTIKTELINRGDYALIVQMFLPPTFDEKQIVKYPLLIQVYGGPGSQNVNENFKMNFGKYLSSSKNIIYAYIDGRGSGYQGASMKYQLYHKLGSVEIEDQIFVAKYLRDKYKYINKDAIGIWGWSYGGYATALVLAKDSIQNPVFSCGISVAPVTSWLLYDSAYTERFMGLPESNLPNYFLSDVMHLSNNFKGKKYLLIHGTADDNVHIQNSMTLIKALNQANVMFQTQIYPDENHALSGVSTHLYNRMESFWNECFQMDSYVEEIGLRRRRIIKHGSV